MRMNAAIRFLAVVVGCLMLTPVAWSKEIKVGILGIFSGPFAHWGTNFRQAVELYQEEHGVQVGDHTISVIFRDTAGRPDAARQIAEEMIIGEQVSVIGGLVLTPEALAVAPLLTEAEIPGVVFNAGTHFVTRQSPMFVRTSTTLDQSIVPMVEWAATEGGVKNAVIAVSDYAPGQQAAESYQEEFRRHDVEVVDVVRMPLDTRDFSVFVQRIRDASPDGVFLFLPAGTPSISFMRTVGERGLMEAGIKVFGLGEFNDVDLPNFDDSILGAYSAWHYTATHDSEKNQAFTAALARKFPGTVADFSTVGAYDGMHVIYEMVRRTNGELGAAAIEAVKGLSWESPRGPVSIDPEERDIIQNIYMRRVVKDGDVKKNEEFEVFPDVKDPWKERNPA